MMSDLLGKLRRAAKKPPKMIAQRLLSELKAESDRLFIGTRRRMPLGAVLAQLDAPSLDKLWERLAARPCAASVRPVAVGEYEAKFPGDAERILRAAEDALAHRVALLGSGGVELGPLIDWHCDFKTGHRWAPGYFRSIEYNNLELPSDVKVPWELSRMQWLIPVGQAYVLTGDDRYAREIRDLLMHWIASNPMGGSVNWSCTMDVALRAIVWTWFFHVFNRADAWKDEIFRGEFIRALYLHGDFVERYIERSDINGNHYTADAAGMAIMGLFWGQGAAPERWAAEGWRILREEAADQVHPDGVDFEASVPYHRLVAELFVWPAIYRLRVGLPVEEDYRNVLRNMARFTAAYMGPDDRAPVWGDADDARVLPFGPQPINDHRYIADLIVTGLGLDPLPDQPGQPSPEIFWALGTAIPRQSAEQRKSSMAFPEGGFYIMRSDIDHVFIDCGPIGLAGRGGHGHNDCLAFEATLLGEPLIVDCGAYLYTANYRERNLFRSTDYHNTPSLDQAEINRFIRPDYLWNMHYDAIPEVLAWAPGDLRDVFAGTHRGFEYVASGARPVRTITLDKQRHRLTVADRIEGGGRHLVSIPFHLHPGVTVSRVEERKFLLATPSARFVCTWQGEGFTAGVEEARISFSYGRFQPSSRLIFRRNEPLPAKLSVEIVPAISSA